MSTLLDLLQKKMDAQLELDKFAAKKPLSTDLAATIEFDIQHRKLFVKSLEADTAYNDAVKTEAL